MFCPREPELEPRRVAVHRLVAGLAMAAGSRASRRRGASVRIEEVRARQDAQGRRVPAAMIVFTSIARRDVADRHRRGCRPRGGCDPRTASGTVVRRSAADRRRSVLPRRRRHRSRAPCSRRATSTASVGSMPPGDQSTARDAHAHRFRVGPHRAARVEHLERRSASDCRAIRRTRRCACWSAAR